MMPLSQKIRADLVELRTNDGPIYVSPSGWDRLYLLWTFRNFHHLPKPVLNHRQQQLIEELCRRAVVSLEGTIRRTRIMGVVENMGVVPDREPATVDFRGTATLTDSSTCDRSGIERIRSWSTNLVGSISQRRSVPQNEPNKISLSSADPPAIRTDSGPTLRWTLAFTYAALLLPVLIYVAGDRRAQPPKSTLPAALQTRSPASDSSLAVARPERVRQLLPVGKVSRSAAFVVAPKPWSSEASFTQHESTNNETAILTQIPETSLDPNPRERLQVAEAPERGIAYPVAPSPNLTGKVSLRALIARDGTVTKVRVLSGNPTLARAAMRAVQHWRYHSYEVDGHEVEAETNITINFVGDDAVSISFLGTPLTAGAELPRSPE